MGATGRFILRLSVVTALAGLAAVRLALGDGSVSQEEAVTIMEATLGAAAVYTGIGFATPAEPRLNVKPDRK